MWFIIWVNKVADRGCRWSALVSKMAGAIDLEETVRQSGFSRWEGPMFVRMHRQKIRMRNLLLAMLFALSTTCASPDELYDRCIDASDGTNPSFAECGSDWVARADVKLNEIWKELYSNADEITKRELLAEQRLWNAYKEQSCNFLRKGSWGREGQVLHFPACRADIIEERTKQLARYIYPRN